MTLELKWYEFRQNNSGGYYIRGDFVSDVVFIQAESYSKADEILAEMVDREEAWEYCECCGERWCSYYNEGSEFPKHLGKPVSEGVDLYDKSGYILFHGFNGKTLKWSGNLNDAPTEIRTA